MALGARGLEADAHLSGARLEHADRLVGVKDVLDGGVHGALAGLGAVLDVGDELVVARGNASGEKNRAVPEVGSTWFGPAI